MWGPRRAWGWNRQAGASKALGRRIDMPCPGSAGRGQAMMFEITYLAVTEPTP